MTPKANTLLLRRSVRLAQWEASTDDQKYLILADLMSNFVFKWPCPEYYLTDKSDCVCGGVCRMPHIRCDPRSALISWRKSELQ